MTLLNVQSMVSLVLAASLIAAEPAIGVAVAGGAFRVDRAEVNGNASLFDGSVVRTSTASSRVRLNGGARLELGADSEAAVYATHARLERGAGQVQSDKAYAIEARAMRVLPEAKSIARVRLDGAGAILVSALNGPVRVSNADGVLLARVGPGLSLRFEQQSGGQPDFYEITGCLLRKKNRVILVDQTTDRVFEVRGADESTEIGNRVTVKGKGNTLIEPIAGASLVISALSVTPVAPGGCLAAATSAGADPPSSTTTPGTPKTAAAGGVNKAVIAGVAIAGGAAAGLAVALGGGNKSK